VLFDQPAKLSVVRSHPARLPAYTQSIPPPNAKSSPPLHLFSPGDPPRQQQSRLKTEKRREAETPLGRTGQPDDVAGIVAFFASYDSAWLTGEIVNASGGFR
jgi:NAD(P)-dependent dehydrogenase (short-subunit alcohol dehydrogenase family)